MKQFGSLTETKSELVPILAIAFWQSEAEGLPKGHGVGVAEADVVVVMALLELLLVGPVWVAVHVTGGSVPIYPPNFLLVK